MVIVLSFYNKPFLETCNHLSLLLKHMALGKPTTQAARASAAMALIMFSRNNWMSAPEYYLLEINTARRHTAIITLAVKIIMALYKTNKIYIPNELWNQSYNQ